MAAVRMKPEFLTILGVLCSCWLGVTAEEVKDEQLRALPCPIADDIYPCICTVIDQSDMAMDCSYVTSNSELARVFSTVFPFTDFFSLVIRNNNYLKSLRPVDLGTIVTFEKIDIHNSILEKIEYNAFKSSYNTLRELSISGTNLYIFPSEEIENFTQLTSLDLSTNKLANFPTLASSTLQYLNLDNNPTGYITPTSLANLPALTTLHMQNVGLTQVLPGTFTGLPLLEFINLSNNEIEVLPAGTVNLQTSNSYAYFHDNNITYIEEGALIGVTSLNLINNQLHELAEAVFKPLMDQSGTSFRLWSEGNPLDCGCEIAWLVISSTYQNHLSDQPTCFSGELVTELDPDIYIALCVP